MAREIQIPMRCKSYTENENLNLTCKNKNRCCIYYGNLCEEYTERKNLWQEIK